MSHAYYAEINLHCVWHTKESRPALTPQVEAVAHDAIRRKAASFRGVICHAVNGVEDHVHVVVSVPPNLLLSEFLGRLKGYSSHAVNQVFPGQAEKFEWQPGYGVVSFGTRNLKWVLRYVADQKEHHRKGTTVERLERFTAAEAAVGDEETGAEGGSAPG